MLQWLQKWYSSQCDGEWEFRRGIKILSVSNPGWSVEIDVSDTPLEGKEIPFALIKSSEHDWYGFLIEDSYFIGSGDPTKLEFIIGIFKKLLESESV